MSQEFSSLPKRKQCLMHTMVKRLFLNNVFRTVMLQETESVLSNSECSDSVKEAQFTWQ